MFGFVAKRIGRARSLAASQCRLNAETITAYRRFESIGSSSRQGVCVGTSRSSSRFERCLRGGFGECATLHDSFWIPPRSRGTLRRRPLDVFFSCLVAGSGNPDPATLWSTSTERNSMLQAVRCCRPDSMCNNAFNRSGVEPSWTLR